MKSINQLMNVWCNCHRYKCVSNGRHAQLTRCFSAVDELLVAVGDDKKNKKAELPQRLPRDSPYNMDALKIFESPWVRPRCLRPRL